MAEVAQAEAPQTDAPPTEAPAVEVQDAQLPPAVDRGTKTPPGQIDILLDTAMTVTACLGEVDIPVRDLLQLGAGSVLKLDRLVGQPIDLYLRGIKFATASLVVVGEQLGVKIKEILSPEAKGQ